MSTTTARPNEGRAYLYRGSATGLAAAPVWTAEGNQEEAFYGRAVASAGDVNGDGYADVVVGALFYDNDQLDEGRAFVYHGSPLGLGIGAAWTAESNQEFADYGHSVASAGDVNGDRYSDVIVGAILYDNGQFREGRVFAYQGSAAGLLASPVWTAESNQGDADFGFSVASAGDVNGDGFADVVVGAQRYDNVESVEGHTWLYYGNGGDGLDRIPRQARTGDQAPIDLLGRSDSGRIPGEGARSHARRAGAGAPRGGSQADGDSVQRHRAHHRFVREHRPAGGFRQRGRSRADRERPDPRGGLPLADAHRHRLALLPPFTVALAPLQRAQRG